jgi:hypothetical protein
VALNKALEELLAQVKDDGDQKALRERFEKYDFLQSRFEANLRQEDYDRNLNKIKQDREAEAALVKTYQEETSKWKDWAANNVPKYNSLLKEYDELDKKYKATEEEKTALVLAAAANPGEGKDKLDPKELLAQVDAQIAKRGYVPPSKEELVNMIAAESKKLTESAIQAERDAFFKTTVPSVMNELASMNNLQFQHREEFGELIDPAAFAKFRGEKQITDINEAYKQFTSEKREAKKIAVMEKEIRDKVEKEYASKMNLPGSGAPPANEFGPLQERALGKNNGLNMDKPGWLEAAEAMRSEGKF